MLLLLGLNHLGMGTVAVFMFRHGVVAKVVQERRVVEVVEVDHTLNTGCNYLLLGPLKQLLLVQGEQQEQLTEQETLVETLQLDH
jgi:hypothetical protein